MAQPLELSWDTPPPQAVRSDADADALRGLFRQQHPFMPESVTPDFSVRGLAPVTPRVPGATDETPFERSVGTPAGEGAARTLAGLLATGLYNPNGAGAGDTPPSGVYLAAAGADDYLKGLTASRTIRQALPNLPLPGQSPEIQASGGEYLRQLIAGIANPKATEWIKTNMPDFAGRGTGFDNLAAAGRGLLADNSPEMQKVRVDSLLRYAAAGGTKKATDFAPGQNGLMSLIQETQSLENDKESKILANLAGQSASIQSQIDRLTALTPQDQRQAAEFAAGTNDPTPWYGSKADAVKTFLADRNAFANKYGNKASNFIDAYDREIESIRQNKENLNADALRGLRYHLQNSLFVTGNILQKHPDWALHLAGGPVAPGGTATTAGAAADPFAAYLSKTHPAPAATPTTATSTAPVAQPVIALPHPAVTLSGGPVAPPAPPLNPNLFRTEQLKRDMAARIASGQSRSDAFANSFNLQDAIDAEARRQQAFKSWLTGLFTSVAPQEATTPEQRVANLLLQGRN